MFPAKKEKSEFRFTDCHENLQARSYCSFSAVIQRFEALKQKSRRIWAIPFLN